MAFVLTLPVILGLIGLIIGLVVAFRLKKFDIIDLLVGAGIFYLFAPALGTISALFDMGIGTGTANVFDYLVALVSFFGLGLVIAFLIKKVITYFQ